MGDEDRTEVRRTEISYPALLRQHGAVTSRVSKKLLVSYVLFTSSTLRELPPTKNLLSAMTGYCAGFMRRSAYFYSSNDIVSRAKAWRSGASHKCQHDYLLIPSVGYQIALQTGLWNACPQTKQILSASADLWLLHLESSDNINAR